MSAHCSLYCRFALITRQLSMKSLDRASAGSSSVCIQLILFFCYLIFGALVFQALELEKEKQERLILLDSRRGLQEKYNVTEEDLKLFIKLVQAIADQGFSNEWVDRWNFIGALFFSGTVVTTIGQFIKLNTEVFWKVGFRNIIGYKHI